jgi:uncharacterized membrane protein
MNKKIIKGVILMGMFKIIGLGLLVVCIVMCNVGSLNANVNDKQKRVAVEEEVKEEVVKKEEVVEEEDEEEVAEEGYVEYKDEYKTVTKDKKGNYTIEYSELFSTIWRVGYDDGYEGVKRDVSNESKQYREAYEDGYEEGKYDFENGMHIDKDTSEIDKLEQAEEVVKSTMAQGYESGYDVAIEDMGIKIMLYVEKFDEENDIQNAKDVERNVYKALRNNEHEDVQIAIHIMNNKNECITIVNGEVIYDVSE